MDRPEDIPQWAWEKSTELCAEWIKEDGSIDVTPHYLVSKAILKAREDAYEECAKIAIRQAPATQDWDDAPLQDLAKRISQAIRQHSQKGER